MQTRLLCGVTVAKACVHVRVHLCCCIRIHTERRTDKMSVRTCNQICVCLCLSLYVPVYKYVSVFVSVPVSVSVSVFVPAPVSVCLSVYTHTRL